ncbi:hypothetical protein DFP81_102255 [Marinomonas pollencensis]|uniref:Uncharacterized protein n=1 Tax=Marinomonas pollencensis TaxID=491954 RepID=A0A3E0DUB2_9GAMM|nr:hypothetical protein DFP81_102255 [Marinomonas pollencensis]
MDTKLEYFTVNIQALYDENIQQNKKTEWRALTLLCQTSYVGAYKHSNDVHSLLAGINITLILIK